MSDVQISSPAIEAFIPQLPEASSSTSHLPIILPLAFPTPTHLLNTLTVLHLVHTVLDNTAHAAYFAATSSEPRDTAIRGVLGLYLSSGEEWTSDNLLSTAAWNKGKISEERLTEIFGIQTTQEREHETMKAIRIGGRWTEGANLSDDLVRLFRDLGEKMDGKANCVGEVVKDLLTRNTEETEEVEAFARACCDEALRLVPTLADSYATPSSAVPAAPLRLLQDLALRQHQSKDLDVPLPSPDELADISPLPLPVALLLQAGILVIPPQQAELQDAVNSYRSDAAEKPSTANVDKATYASLQAKSVEACDLIRESARTQSRDLTQLDILHACEELEKQAQKDRTLLHLVLS